MRDEAAMKEFEEFLSRYEDMVYTTAVRLLGSRAEAEDMAQEAFLKAFERFDALKTSETAGGWLKTVTTNLCLNHLSRHRKRWTLFSELDTDEAPFDAPEETVPLPEVSDEALEAAVAALPDHQRLPLVLFHFEDLSYDEIASRLGLSLAKVKSDIFRGRAALRKSLEAA